MGAPTPPLIVQGFGALAGGGYINNPIPVASQIGITPGAASYTDGFPPLTMAPTGGVNPFGQDMNGILLAATANIAALTGGQFWPFSATWAAANSGYALGAIVAMAGGYGFWINQVAANSNNPDTTAAATSGWAPLAAYGVQTMGGLTTGVVTLTADQAALPNIVFTGTLTGNVQIVFPTWTNRWTVINKTTGAYTLTCKTASGTGVIIPQATQPSLIAGDGTNIQALSVYAPSLITKAGSFNCINGTVAVTFATSFATACTAIAVQWEYSTPDVGFVVPGSRTAAGFQYTNGNGGACTYIAAGN